MVPSASSPLLTAVASHKLAKAAWLTVQPVEQTYTVTSSDPSAHYSNFCRLIEQHMLFVIKLPCIAGWWPPACTSPVIVEYICKTDNHQT